ncbi:hypothetical protein FRAHR75_400006 [Frankia sp. Hr75.2]|nr:hypothetical protein FRAHR75_400006 [Frankia sp. Hr75.2]
MMMVDHACVTVREQYSSHHVSIDHAELTSQDEASSEGACPHPGGPVPSEAQIMTHPYASSLMYVTQGDGRRSR